MNDEQKLHNLAKSIAKSMTGIRGLDPDATVPETGYKDSAMIPQWRHDYEWALRFIAGYAVMKELSDDQRST